MKGKRPIRVAHVMGKMQGGGVESFVLEHQRHLRHRQVRFDFIVDSDSTHVPRQRIRQLGGRVFPVAPVRFPLRRHRELLRLFRLGHWSMVHAHHNTRNLFSLMAARQAGVPVRIAHSHSTAGAGEALCNVAKQLLRPFSCVAATHLCACSAHAGRWLFGRRRMQRGDVTLLTNAIDLSRFAHRPSVRDAMRDRLGITARFVVGHTGRFVTQKNHRFLLDVFAEIHKRRGDAVLLLAGDGPLRESIRRRAEQLGLAERVLFLGMRDDVDDLLQAMDVFVFPSLYEGLGIAAVEAQAAALPTIVSERVPAETRLTPLVRVCSLAATPAVWAEAALASSALPRASQSQHLAQCGYDIVSAAADLEQWYRTVASGD